MDLDVLLRRVAEGIAQVDALSEFVGENQRTKASYLPGVPAMTESQLAKELVDWWVVSHPKDFSPLGSCLREISYPSLPGAFCDIVFTSEDHTGAGPEWAIELKRIQFIGDNGKNNDFNVQKMLSPYLKDRSLIHDMHRMRKHPLAARHAVVGYAFSYSYASCDQALARHANHSDRIDEIRKVCRRNDRQAGKIEPEDLVDFADSLFQDLDLVIAHERTEFTGLWRHPCGGNGLVFGWEVKPDPLEEANTLWSA